MVRLLPQLDAAVPGGELWHDAAAVGAPAAALGDNATAVWNVWWFQHALEQSKPLYRTSMLFAPFGTQLSLHTHATTHSLISWPMAALTSLVAGHNLAIIAGLALNGITTWLLAFRVTRRLLPSAVAGLVFASSAFVQLRVLGHINLVHAWVLPLFALAFIRLANRPAPGAALAAGAAAALVIYTDYYFSVYAALFAAIWSLVLTTSIRVIRRPERLRLLPRVLLLVMAIDLLIIVVIPLTGGTALDLGVAKVSIRGVRNPLTLFWLLLAAWAICRYPVTLSLRWRGSRPSRESLRAGALTLAAVVVLTAPLWTALLGVIAAGEYTTQRVLWRSSPPGVDALTLVLGHPRHILTGGWTIAAYTDLGIDMMEQGLWLGIVPLVLIVARRKDWAGLPGARAWMVVGFTFFVLALGPFLRVGGLDMGLPLPHAGLRYLPVFSNARIPGRAAVMVHLSIAMLTAFALASRRDRASAAALVVFLIGIEVLPAPVSAQPIPPPDSVDGALQLAAPGSVVAELPLGIRDGFGETGSLDHRALIRQMWHERPLVGGFVARLPARVRAGYADTLILSELLAISTPSVANAALPADAADRSAALGIDFVVVNRDTFVGERLSRAAMQAAGFSLVEVSGPRELYSTGAPRRQ